MTTVSEAFDRFQTRLQTTPTEDAAASRRQQTLRQQLGAADTFDIVDHFLTGSYRRETKTKPLRDVDIMIVLSNTGYLDRHPREILDDVCAVLEPHYEGKVETDRRAVRVDFGVRLVDDLSGDVVSFDVVPAFTDGSNYLIPDDVLGTWISTNPQKHYDLARDANADYADKWKPLVKVLKTWNNHQGKPIEPSFLIEVMALDILTGTWGGSRKQEIRQFFATAAARIDDAWPDPAGLGPNVSDTLQDDPAALAKARAALLDAEKACTEAMRQDRAGQTGAALTTWRGLFGPAFPIS